MLTRVKNWFLKPEMGPREWNNWYMSRVVPVMLFVGLGVLAVIYVAR